MPSIRLPLATTFLNRTSAVTKDAKIVNGYIEKYNEEHTAVVKRPGLSFHSAGLGCGQGFYTYNETLYSMSGGVIQNTEIETGQIWTEVTAAAFATGRSFAPVVYFNSKFWYLGGLTDTPAVTNDIYSSSDGITWDLETTSNPFTARYRHEAVVFNDKIYIIGGFTGSHSLFDVWSSTDGINWTNILVDLYPVDASYGRRSSHKCVVFNSKIWILGGDRGSFNYDNDIWSSSDGITWTEEVATASWSARSAFAIAYRDGYWWLTGGETGSTTTVNDVWKSTNLTTWTLVTAAAAWSTRAAHALHCFGGKLTIIAGTNDLATSLNDVWTSTDGITWTQATSVTPFGNRAFFGSITQGGYLWIIAGGIVGGSRISSVWKTVGGSCSDSCLLIDFNQSSASASTKYIMYKSTLVASLITVATGASNPIVDTDYPAVTVPGVVFLDGYFFVMTPDGEIHNSALEDPTSWSALDFITAEMEPDAGVALAKHLNYIVAFGESTTEFFFDAANATGSPLQRVENAFMFYGCASGHSVVHMNNTLVWMSQTLQQGRQIAVMNGFAPQIISTPFVERILAADSLATVYSFNTKVNGHDFYVLTLKTSNITLAYDFVTRTWFQWTSMRAQAAKSVTSVTLGTDGVTATAVITSHGYADGDLITFAGADQAYYNGDFNITYIDANTVTYPVTGASVSPATGTITAVGYTEGYFRGTIGGISNGTSLIQDETTGDLYEIDMSNYTDTTGYINFLVRTTNFDGGSMDTKYPARLEVIGDKETNSHLLVRYSNDDYSTYSKYRKLDLSKKRSRLNRLGSFKRRSFDLRHTDSTPVRLEQMELIVDRGGDA